ncbi:hypothetical protein Zmor_027061 [Zophobas morio]|uniref:Uncharacterized protein n=1 Tax=Zophobas morio TaxID=2755281 RepID=A0AA38HJ24_9CUCU|nr:hypothetical protein Zmor_027061 [Zophobas morio]
MAIYCTSTVPIVAKCVGCWEPSTDSFLNRVGQGCAHSSYRLGCSMQIWRLRSPHKTVEETIPRMVSKPEGGSSFQGGLKTVITETGA